MEEDFSALERVENLIKTSTFLGDAADKVSTALALIKDLKIAVVVKMKQEAENEKE